MAADTARHTSVKTKTNTWTPVPIGSQKALKHCFVLPGNACHWFCRRLKHGCGYDTGVSFYLRTAWASYYLFLTSLPLVVGMISFWKNIRTKCMYSRKDLGSHVVDGGKVCAWRLRSFARNRRRRNADFFVCLFVIVGTSLLRVLRGCTVLALAWLENRFLTTVDN